MAKWTKFGGVQPPREYYSESIAAFLDAGPDEILGALARNSDFDLEQTQRDAWLEEIKILHSALSPFQGSIYFEYSIPRMGQRIDVVILTGPVIFVLEFKVGEQQFTSYAMDQVWDYALDLKNFHESSHERLHRPNSHRHESEPSATSLSPSTAHDRLLLADQIAADQCSAM